MTRPADASPLPAFLRPLASPLRSIYALAIARRNKRFEAGIGVIRFDRPVISVGNLSTGGTGKTPMVQFIVRALLDAGHHPCIAMRGYASRGGESDEADTYHRLFPGVPVIAQRDRTHGLISLFAREHDSDDTHTDCIILDDGFQHRQIGRELDIVLIDGTRDPFADRLLPAGWLREPVTSLSRADLVVLTHAERLEESRVRAIDGSVARARSRPLDAITRHAWTTLDVRPFAATSPETDETHPASWLRGKRIVVACAIGNPGAFLAQARDAIGAPLAAEIVLRDHDPFDREAVTRIIESARATSAHAVLVTDKDWSKLRHRSIAWPCAIARPRLELSFDRGRDELLSRVISVVRAGVPDDSQSLSSTSAAETLATPASERGTLGA
jgi:tetraacyldisaccharide 4'-kinase